MTVAVTESASLAAPVAVPVRARRKRRRPGGSLAARILIYLALVSYCLSTVGAFVWCVMVSLKSNPEFFSSSPWSAPEHARIGNYGDAWNNARIGSFFLNSLYVTAVSVAASLGFSLMAAYALTRVPFRGRTLVRLVFLSGLMMPGFLVIVPLYFMLRDLHLLGSLNGLIIVYVASQMPFNVFVLSSFFASLPKELEEAAYVDGASPSRTFFSIVVPQTMPAIASVGLLNTLTIWNEFFFALVFLTDENTQTIPVGILGLSVNAEYSGQWVQLFAGLVISMIPMLIIFGLAQDRITKGLSAGGLKG
jgi:raffinose/stachyose/melibiose transport system permease protein/N-acetylglucosamine transport system permease protein